MASLYIAEFATAGVDQGRSVPVGACPPVAEQKLNIDVSATVSAPFNTNTRLVRVHTDAICSILIGADPTATDAKMRMAAGSTEYFAVIPGQKLSVITNT